jgi:hypothetical protein
VEEVCACRSPKKKKTGWQLTPRIAWQRRRTPGRRSNQTLPQLSSTVPSVWLVSDQSSALGVLQPASRGSSFYNLHRLPEPGANLNHDTHVFTTHRTNPPVLLSAAASGSLHRPCFKNPSLAISYSPSDINTIEQHPNSFLEQHQHLRSFIWRDIIASPAQHTGRRSVCTRLSPCGSCS